MRILAIYPEIKNNLFQKIKKFLFIQKGNHYLVDIVVDGRLMPNNLVLLSNGIKYLVISAEDNVAKIKTEQAIKSVGMPTDCYVIVKNWKK